MTILHQGYSDILPQQGYDTLVGLIILGGITVTALALYYKIDKFRKDRKADAEEKEEKLKQYYKDKLQEEAKQIEERIKLTKSLEDLRNSNLRLSDNICSLNESIKIRFEKVETVIEKHDKQIIRVVASSKSAHKRLDEHLQSERHNGKVKDEIIGEEYLESED